MINLRDYDKLQEGIAIGLEQGLEQGIKEAGNIMPNIVERLRKGESRESIILLFMLIQFRMLGSSRKFIILTFKTPVSSKQLFPMSLYITIQLSQA